MQEQKMGKFSKHHHTFDVEVHENILQDIYFSEATRNFPFLIGKFPTDMGRLGKVPGSREGSGGSKSRKRESFPNIITPSSAAQEW